MTNDKIKELVIEAIREVALDFKQDTAPVEITGEHKLRELGIDSLDLIEIEMHIEEKFGLKEFSIEPQMTIDEIVTSISSKYCWCCNGTKGKYTKGPMGMHDFTPCPNCNEHEEVAKDHE